MLRARHGTELAIAGKKLPSQKTLRHQSNKHSCPKRHTNVLEALRSVGVDVSCLFAMQEPTAAIMSPRTRTASCRFWTTTTRFSITSSKKGTVPNRRLFRRFVMAQMFHMLSYKDYGAWSPVGVTEMIHRFGFEYQWKMLLDELRAQMKMERNDPENFADRNRWFNVKGRYGSGGRLHRTTENACRWPAGQEMQGIPLQASRRPQHFRAGPALQTLQPAASCSVPYRSG